MGREGKHTCASLKHCRCWPSVPMSLCPHHARPNQLLGCRDSCIEARGGGFPGLGESICVAVAVFLGSNAHLLPSLSRCRPPARALVPVPWPPSPLPWLPHCPMPCAPCSVLPHPARPPQPPRFQALLSTLTPPEEHRCPPARLLPVGWPARPPLLQVLRHSLPQGLPWVWGPWASP